MAFKPLRPCRHVGCTELTRDGYCPKHKAEKKARKSSEDWHKFYRLPWWKQARAEQLTKEPFCRECLKLGLKVKATEVDHVIPHRGNRELFFDKKNLQSLCKRHHSSKTMQELRENKKKS